MSNSGVLGDPLGTVGDLGKQVGKGIGDEAAKIEKTTRVQVGIESQQEIDSKKAQGQVPNVPSSNDTLEIVKKMYETSKTKINVPSDKIISGVIQENPKKTPDEIQKLAATRQQLFQQQHTNTYFDPTFNRPLRPEERLADKLEKEKQEKRQMEALQAEEERKKELPRSVKQGTNEKDPGMSG